MPKEVPYTFLPDTPEGRASVSRLKYPFSVVFVRPDSAPPQARQRRDARKEAIEYKIRYPELEKPSLSEDNKK